MDWRSYVQKSKFLEKNFFDVIIRLFRVIGQIFEYLGSLFFKNTNFLVGANFFIYISNWNAIFLSAYEILAFSHIGACWAWYEEFSEV